MESEEDFTISECEENNFNDDDEECLIDIETSPELRLDSVSKSKATSGIWKDFGILKKGGRILQKMRNKIHCKLCFANKVLKRYANLVQY